MRLAVWLQPTEKGGARIVASRQRRLSTGPRPGFKPRSGDAIVNPPPCQHPEARVQGVYKRCTRDAHRSTTVCIRCAPGVHPLYTQARHLRSSSEKRRGEPGRFCGSSQGESSRGCGVVFRVCLCGRSQGPTRFGVLRLIFGGERGLSCRGSPGRKPAGSWSGRVFSG